MRNLVESNFGAFMILIALIIVAVLLFAKVLESTTDQIEWYEETYIVRRGDTLWEIADQYCPANVDKREWIYEVKCLNGLEDSSIYPGQRLRVMAPVE